jgi:hypothetical protein
MLPSRLVRCAMCAHSEGGERERGLGADGRAWALCKATLLPSYVAQRVLGTRAQGAERITAGVIAGRLPFEPQRCVLILNSWPRSPWHGVMGIIES